MTRFICSRDAFNFSWEDVSRGFWRRYPNPHSAHVLSEDIISRYITRDGSLVTKRLLIKTNPMPRFGEYIVGKIGNTAKIVEESIVDPVSKTITTYTRNIGLKNVMQIEEKCVYRPDPSSPHMRTICERQAWISSSLAGVSMIVTKFGFERFKSNTQKATLGFVHVLEQLYAAGQGQNIPMGARVASQQAVHQATEKLKEKAKKATEMAKSKIPLVAAES
ncbi:PRELI domain-containing protein 1 [Tropilaelaps mercedesae]|uniref:PRELI domain-containing protein 1 n=1 Tax=Tropilaelaps mercedesae TaxID=418985 RepID=A0A1V9XLH2_9ACAR|nr:PRELI domain-containing protein 1 [Tropilaelaps mercedesae]